MLNSMILFQIHKYLEFKEETSTKIRFLFKKELYFLYKKKLLKYRYRWNEIYFDSECFDYN